MKKTSLTKIVLMWALFLMPTLLVHAQDEEVVATAKPTVFVDKISAGSSSDKLTVLNAVATALTQSGRVIVITSDSERASSFIDQHNSQDDVTAGSDMVAERLAVSMKLGVQYYLRSRWMISPIRTTRVRPVARLPSRARSLIPRPVR